MPLPFVLISACRDAGKHISSCVNSVKRQTYRNWKLIIVVDDTNSDVGKESLRVAREAAVNEPRITVIPRSERNYALANQLHILDNYCPQDAIVGKLDTDDELSHENVLQIVEDKYRQDPELDALWTKHTKTNRIMCCCKPIPPNKDPLDYGWSTSHFQTFRRSLLSAVRRHVFTDPQTGTFWHTACDQALYLSVLSHARKYMYLPQVCYKYRANRGDNVPEIQKAHANRVRANLKKDGGRVKKPKNVLFLVNGTGHNSDKRFYSQERRPPLGVLSMISHLRARRHKVTLVDRFMNPNWWPTKETWDAADVLCVYASTPNALDAKWIIQQARISAGFKGPIYAGGPHAILWPDDLLSWGADIAYGGEADFAISYLVENGAVPDNYPKRIEDLNTVPFPSYTQLKEQGILGKYGSGWPFGKETKILSLNTSRGCPHGCAFCDIRTLWGRKWNAQSPARVLTDVDYLRRTFGAKGVYFREDNFCCDVPRLLEIADGMTIGPLKEMIWACEMRADVAKPETLKRLADSGCRGFYVGAESGSDALLEKMNKGIKAQQTLDLCREAKKNGIKVALSMIDGFPGETVEDKKLTEKLIKDAGAHAVWRGKYRKTWADHLAEGKSPLEGKVVKTGQMAPAQGVQATVIITCKGRLHHLKKTIPEHLKYDPGFDYRILVVDYGCPDGTYEWVKSLNNPKVGAVKVKSGVEFFNLSRGRNCGATHALGDILVFCDADVYPKDGWLKKIVNQVMKPHIVMTRPKWKRGGCGICAIRRNVYDHIRGHDENLKGWGYEDIDLKARAEEHGKVGYYEPELFVVMKHSREQSVQYYEDKNLRHGFPTSNLKNKKIVQQRKGLPNPGGYGQGDMDVWWADQ